MADTEEHALAPDALQRVTPRRWLIDLRAEGLGDATYEEILSPVFWQEGVNHLRYADIVTLIRGSGETLDVQVSPYPDGSIHVMDLAAHGRRVPPHPDLASRHAANNPQEAA